MSWENSLSISAFLYSFLNLYSYPPDSKCSSLFSQTLHLEFALTWYNSALFSYFSYEQYIFD